MSKIVNKQVIIRTYYEAKINGIKVYRDIFGDKLYSKKDAYISALVRLNIFFSV